MAALYLLSGKIAGKFCNDRDMLPSPYQISPNYVINLGTYYISKVRYIYSHNYLFEKSRVSCQVVTFHERPLFRPM